MLQISFFIFKETFIKLFNLCLVAYNAESYVFLNESLGGYIYFLPSKTLCAFSFEV